MWEFALRCPKPAREVLPALLEAGIVGGLDLGGSPETGVDDPAMADCLLVAVTEMNSPASLDAFVAALP
jgi:glycine dehydrogenase subunit 1